LGTRCETCGHWYHNSFGNMKAWVVESGKWSCNRCRYERLQVPEEALCSKLMSWNTRIGLWKSSYNWRQMERKFDERDTALVRREGKKRLVLGDLIVGNAGTEHSHMRVECFPGIRTAQLPHLWKTGL
jgi:hypothetical protein